MRFRFRGKLAPLGQAVIVKVTADNEFEAVEEVARTLRSEGHDLSKITSVSVRPIDSAKSTAVYIGEVPKARAPKAKAAPAKDGTEKAAPAKDAKAAAPAPAKK